jgi:hypothetical protein
VLETHIEWLKRALDENAEVQSRLGLGEPIPGVFEPKEGEDYGRIRNVLDSVQATYQKRQSQLLEAENDRTRGYELARAEIDIQRIREDDLVRWFQYVMEKGTAQNAIELLYVTGEDLEARRRSEEERVRRANEIAQQATRRRLLQEKSDTSVRIAVAAAIWVGIIIGSALFAPTAYVMVMGFAVIVAPVVAFAATNKVLKGIWGWEDQYGSVVRSPVSWIAGAIMFVLHLLFVTAISQVIPVGEDWLENPRWSAVKTIVLLIQFLAVLVWTLTMLRLSSVVATPYGQLFTSLVRKLSSKV